MKCVNKAALDPPPPPSKPPRALLVQHWECPEEGARNVVAECLGRLSLSRPQELLPRLEACLASPSPLARATVVAAAKWALAERSGPWVAVPAFAFLMREMLFIETFQSQNFVPPSARAFSAKFSREIDLA